MHKVMRKTRFTNISSKTEPYYPFKLTSDKNGYEIRGTFEFPSKI